VTERLSSARLRFNKLTARIGKLEKEIAKDEAKLEYLFGVYARDVRPPVLEYGRLLAAVAVELHTFTLKSQLKKKHTEQLQALLLHFIRQSFRITSPTAEEQTIYDMWARKNGVDDQGPFDDHDKTRRRSNGSRTDRPKTMKSKKHLAEESRVLAEESIKDRTIRNVYIALAKVTHPDTGIDPKKKRS
jgi:hypothetical protein